MGDDLEARYRKVLLAVCYSCQDDFQNDLVSVYDAAAAMARAIEAVEDETAPETGWTIEDHKEFVHAALDAARRVP